MKKVKKEFSHDEYSTCNVSKVLKQFLMYLTFVTLLYVRYEWFNLKQDKMIKICGNFKES